MKIPDVPPSLAVFVAGGAAAVILVQLADILFRYIDKPRPAPYPDIPPRRRIPGPPADPGADVPPMPDELGADPRQDKTPEYREPTDGR